MALREVVICPEIHTGTADYIQMLFKLYLRRTILFWQVKNPVKVSRQ